MPLYGILALVGAAVLVSGLWLGWLAAAFGAVLLTQALAFACISDILKRFKKLVRIVDSNRMDLETEIDELRSYRATPHHNPHDTP